MFWQIQMPETLSRKGNLVAERERKTTDQALSASDSRVAEGKLIILFEGGFKLTKVSYPA
jgi:hypothetical protein